MDDFTVHHMTVQLNGNLVAGTALMPLIVADAVNQGGGFTIIGAQFQAGALTGVGTAYTLALVHGGYQGTVLGGTVAVPIGGSAAASNFAADSVYAWTLAGTLTFAAGDSLSIRKVASGVNMSPTGVVHIQYMPGR